MKEPERERIKLTATFINGLAIACVTFGLIAPLIAALYGLVNAAPVPDIFLKGAGWVAIAILLHLLASWYLGDLDE